jgi:ABC-type amino acid transport substrate-binding protein
MQILRIFFILIFICLMSLNSALGGQDRPEPVNVAYCEYLPFYFKGGNGEIRGIFVDFWRLWSEKTGVPIQFSLMPWEETLQQVREGKVDINAGVFYTPERDVFLDFSIPFFDVSSYLFYGVDVRPPPDLNNLSGYRVGAVSGSFSIDYLEKRNIEATEYINHERMVTDAINGKIDAFMMEAPVAMTYLAKHNGLKQIRKSDVPVYTQQYRSGVREGNKELLAIINQGLNRITPQEIDLILSNWTGKLNPTPIDRTIKKVVIAASIDQVPFHFVDENGQVVGMLIDLWRLWGEKNGIDVEFKTGVWSETLKMVRDGKADIHAGCFYSKERDKYLDYAAPLKGCDTHFFFHQSIFGLKNIEDLIGFKIGALENDYAVDFVRQELAGAYIAEYPSNKALFDAVEDGELRVFVGDTPTALFFLSKKGLLSEYRHHPARPLYSHTYFGAVKEGRSSLVTLINKGFEAISAEERAAIERRWMGSSDYKTKDVMIIAYEKAYPPFSMLDSQGNPSGMLIDFWRLWAKKNGKKIEFRVFDRFDAMDAVAVDKADVHGGLSSSRGQDNGFAFSRPFYRMGSHLFYRSDRNIKEIDDLKGQQIGIVRDTHTAAWIGEQLPAEQAEIFSSEEEMILAALNREVDFFAGPLHVILALLSRHGRMGEFRYISKPLFTRAISAGIKENNQELLKILNAGIGAVSHEEMVDIESAWIPDKTLRFYKPRSHQISLSENEKKWVQDHQHIRLGVPPDFPPFDFMDKDGIHMGIASDYVKILNERLGTHIDVVPDLTWSQVMSKAKAEKREIDLVSSAARTDDMQAYMLFADPYTSFPWVIITRKDTPLIGGLRDLYGRKTAVIKEYAMHERLVRDHPGIPLVLTDSVA